MIHFNIISHLRLEPFKTNILYSFLITTKVTETGMATTGVWRCDGIVNIQ